MQCSRCGQQNAEESRFCSQCGNALQGGAGEAGDGPVGRTGDTSTISLAALEGALDGEPRGDAVIDGSPEAVDGLPLGTALLVVKRGPNAGSRFLLEKPTTKAGRHPDSDIFLDDVTVSRRHAEFRRSDAGFTVRDVGSLNGTYLNRERIDETPLVGGDEVQIGKYRLLFLASSGDA